MFMTLIEGMVHPDGNLLRIDFDKKSDQIETHNTSSGVDHSVDEAAMWTLVLLIERFVSAFGW